MSCFYTVLYEFYHSLNVALWVSFLTWLLSVVVVVLQAEDAAGQGSLHHWPWVWECQQHLWARTGLHAQDAKDLDWLLPVPDEPTQDYQDQEGGCWGGDVQVLSMWWWWFFFSSLNGSVLSVWLVISSMVNGFGGILYAYCSYYCLYSIWFFIYWFYFHLVRLSLPYVL